MFCFRLTPCRSNHSEGLKGSQWAPQRSSPLSIHRSISPSSLANALDLKCNLANAFFHSMINAAGETHRRNTSNHFLSEKCVTAADHDSARLVRLRGVRSEKVQMLLVPGGLVNRVHRLSPSCYSFCLAPPSLRLTVCACCRSPGCYTFAVRHQTVTSDPTLPGVLQRVSGSGLFSYSEDFLYSPFLTVYVMLPPPLSLPVVPRRVGGLRRSASVVYIPHIWSRVLPPGRYSM